MNRKQLTEKIKQLVAYDQLDEALILLMEHFKNDAEIDAIIMQNARYSRLKKETSYGTAKPEHINQELNLLNQSIIAFVNNQVSAQENLEDTNNKHMYFEEFLLSVTRVEVSKVLINEYGSNNIDLDFTTILKISGLKHRKYVVKFILEMQNNNLVVKKNKIGNKTTWELNVEGLEFLKKLNL
ncbi:hypothetical protein [Haliscomenobacter hydrossis]|uniref:Effector-associated domain-containing protein n=1 Tax=Haliscomenobacter hydrossis (strain ATCC 27775 / DSM 1100 / LMG 10767 / O) TaxID=760192 RepID=F4L4W0_HALH1|nr:hypothetical protein Halhy_6201 [Haliscomenobacter hydrossis DSM 1100]